MLFLSLLMSSFLLLATSFLICLVCWSLHIWLPSLQWFFFSNHLSHTLPWSFLWLWINNDYVNSKISVSGIRVSSHCLLSIWLTYSSAPKPTISQPLWESYPFSSLYSAISSLLTLKSFIPWSIMKSLFCK